MNAFDRLTEVAARFGVAVLDKGAEGMAIVLDAVRDEIAKDLVGLQQALRVLKALGNMARVEHFPDELAAIATQLSVNSPEDLEAALEMEIATLEQLGREMNDLGADDATATGG